MRAGAPPPSPSPAVLGSPTRPSQTLFFCLFPTHLLLPLPWGLHRQRQTRCFSQQKLLLLTSGERNLVEPPHSPTAVRGFRSWCGSIRRPGKQVLPTDSASASCLPAHPFSCYFTLKSKVFPFRGWSRSNVSPIYPLFTAIYLLGHLGGCWADNGWEWDPDGLAGSRG